ncbi:MAG TPA: hypothetical protein VJX67_22095 [Blastocatellia bacterium]|nr:hypothetical protein [Blastocatellia bacterium]
MNHEEIDGAAIDGWDEIERVLIEGTREQMESIACPNCDGEIAFEYSEEFGSFIVRCVGCRSFSKACGGMVRPRCAEIYGDKATITGRSFNAHRDHGVS